MKTLFKLRIYYLVCMYDRLCATEVTQFRGRLTDLKARRTIFKKCYKTDYCPLLSFQTLFLRMSSAATRASPATFPFWMMGCHNSFGV